MKSSSKKVFDNVIEIDLNGLNAQDLARLQVVLQLSELSQTDQNAVAELTSEIMQTGIGNAGLSDYLEELTKAAEEIDDTFKL